MIYLDSKKKELNYKEMSIKLNCLLTTNVHNNIQNVILLCKNKEIPLNNIKLYTFGSVRETEHLFKRLRMIWCQLEDIILEDKLPPDFKNICENNEIVEELQNCIFLCTDYVSEKTKSALENQIMLFRRSIFDFHEMEASKLSKINYNALKKVSSGINQYFHTYLNMQWHLIILEYCLFNYSKITRNHIVEFMNDLTTLSYLTYDKGTILEQESSPFLCPCVKIVWVCLQLLSEEQSNQEFWCIFNEVLKEKNPVFSLWLLSHVAQLQGIDETGNYFDATSKRITPNMDFLESKLKSLLNSENSNMETVHLCLLNIEPLVNVWWCDYVKVSFFQLLWEYFYKNLNVAPENTTFTKALQTLTTVKNLITDSRSAKTAFQLYIGMLTIYLKKHGDQWSKLKGRIYSRLPVKKPLGNSALYNVYLLFLCLSSVDFEELTGRIYSMLENLPEEQKNSIFAWNLYCGLVS